MDTREIAKELRLTYWAGIMRERKESGLNAKAFCESTGIHPNVYFYWQRKLRMAACEENIHKDLELESKATALIPNGWAICKEAKPEQTETTIIIEIGKSRVTVNANTDSVLLEKTCRMLVSLC